MSTSIELPLSRNRSLFGQIVDPRILVQVWTAAGYRGHRFLVDTEAEISVVPRRLAGELALDWDMLAELGLSGIGPGRVSARLGVISLRVGDLDLSVRCAFLDQPDAPYILGCADVLDQVALTIDAGQGKIIFTAIP